MGQDLIVSAIALALTILPLNASGSAQIQSQTVQTPQVREIVVKPGDSLSSIAENEYGSKDFWTNVWNNNPNIQDPSLIEKGDKIKLSLDKPSAPEELKSELTKRLEDKNKLAFTQVQSETPKLSTQEDKKQSPQAPMPTPTPTTYSGGPLTQEQINFLGNCESGMTATRNSGNGYYGAFQFSYGTWRSMGTGYERADMAPLETQVDAVQRLVARSSVFTQFPGCSAKMRAQGIL